MIIALKFLLVMTILTGIIYPLLITGVAQLFFPGNANGSMVVRNGKIVGSALIGQKFDSTIYFWSRPSAIGYNPVPSGASNYGPTSDTLKKLVKARTLQFMTGNSITDMHSVPVEMIFASGSGLDPHISPEAVFLQADRVVRARNFNETQKQKVMLLIKNMTEQPQFSLFGEPRINVFELNLAIDQIR